MALSKCRCEQPEFYKKAIQASLQERNIIVPAKELRERLCCVYLETVVYVCDSNVQKHIKKTQLTHQIERIPRLSYSILGSRSVLRQNKKYDFSTLDQGQELSTFLVQDMIELINHDLVLQKRKDILVVCLPATYYFEECKRYINIKYARTQAEKFYQQKLSEFEYIIIPFLIKKHYALALINIEDMTCIFFDSKKGHISDLVYEQQIELKIEQFMENIGFYDVPEGQPNFIWEGEFFHGESPQQDGDTDCGVYMITNIINIIRNSSKQLYPEYEYSDDLYRTQIKESLQLGYLQYRIKYIK